MKIKTIDLSVLNKGMLVDVAKSCGYRRDWARQNMPELVELLTKHYESTGPALDSGFTACQQELRNAIYAHTPYGWSEIAKWEGTREAATQRKMGEEGGTVTTEDLPETPAKISESSAENSGEKDEVSDAEIIKEDLIEAKEGEESDGDDNPFDSGKGKGDKDEGEEGDAASKAEGADGSLPEAVGDAGKMLAHVIRESEREAIKIASDVGVRGIPPVHDALIEAIGGYSETLAKSIFATIAESMGETLEKLSKSTKLGEVARGIEALKKQVDEARENLPHVIQVKDASGTVVGSIDGFTHQSFEDLLRLLNTRKADGTRLNVWLVGPAGTGKTRAAIDAATVLGLRFRSIGALTAEHKAVGFRAAGGDYIPTGFREVWEHGGVFLFDEFDGSIANAAVAMNQAFSTPIFTFPDGNAVARHADCCLIAACNTYGNGSTDYVGRFKQDKASLDRFVFLDWQIDEKLEMNLATNKGWAKRVQAARKALKSKSIQHLITPRATIDGCAMLESGFSVDKCDAMVLRKGLTPDQWESLGMPSVTTLSAKV